VKTCLQSRSKIIVPLIVLLLITNVVVSVAAQTTDEGLDESDSHALELRPFSVRIGGGLTLPLGDLANDLETTGWTGNQGVGFTLSAGVRIPLTATVAIRPEISMHRFGAGDIGFTAIRGSGASIDTIGAKLTRQAMVAGLGAWIDYIPAGSGETTLYLTGGLGLLYARYSDDVTFDDGATATGREESTTLVASGGIGLLAGPIDALFSIGIRQPRFDIVGDTTWSSADLTIALDLPVP